MTIASNLVNEFQGDALFAIEQGIDDIAESYEDDFEKGERVYRFADGSELVMCESIIYVKED